MLLLPNPVLTPKRLGQVLALTPPNLTLLLDRLQQRGLLLRERSEVDVVRIDRTGDEVFLLKLGRSAAIVP